MTVMGANGADVLQSSDHPIRSQLRCGDHLETKNAKNWANSLDSEVENFDQQAAGTSKLLCWSAPARSREMHRKASCSMKASGWYAPDTVEPVAQSTPAPFGGIAKQKVISSVATKRPGPDFRIAAPVRTKVRV